MMNNDPVRFVVSFGILDGRLEEFQEVARAMIASTQEEPGTLAYDWCLNKGRTQCRVVEKFATSEDAYTHLMGPVVQEMMPKLLQTARIDAIEVYGDPDPAAENILTALGAQIFRVWHGIER